MWACGPWRVPTFARIDAASALPVFAQATVVFPAQRYTARSALTSPVCRGSREPHCLPLPRAHSPEDAEKGGLGPSNHALPSGTQTQLPGGEDKLAFAVLGNISHNL